MYMWTRLSKGIVKAFAYKCISVNASITVLWDMTPIFTAERGLRVLVDEDLWSSHSSSMLVSISFSDGCMFNSRSLECVYALEKRGVKWVKPKETSLLPGWPETGWTPSPPATAPLSGRNANQSSASTTTPTPSSACRTWKSSKPTVTEVWKPLVEETLHWAN